MSRKIAGLAALIVLLAAAEGFAQASFGGNTGSSSLGGGRGSSVAGGRSSGRTFGGGGAAQEATQAGRLTGNERFIRENRQPGAFVGADSGEAQEFFGGAGRQTGGQFGGFNGGGLSPFVSPGGNPFGNFGGGGRAAAESAPVIPHRLSVAFDYARPRGASVSARLANRFQNSNRFGFLRDVQVVVVDQTATIRGQVATPHDRALAERLVALEPGVASIRNELTVSEELSPPPLTGANP